MEFLPNELLAYILSFCGEHSLITRGVCSLWKEFSPPSTKFAYINKLYLDCFYFGTSPSSDILNYINFRESEHNITYFLQFRSVGIFLYFTTLKENRDFYIPIVANHISFEFIKSVYKLEPESIDGYVLVEFVDTFRKNIQMAKETGSESNHMNKTLSSIAKWVNMSPFLSKTVLSFQKELIKTENFELIRKHYTNFLLDYWWIFAAKYNKVNVAKFLQEKKPNKKLRNIKHVRVAIESGSLEYLEWTQRNKSFVKNPRHFVKLKKSMNKAIKRNHLNTVKWCQKNLFPENQ